MAWASQRVWHVVDGGRGRQGIEQKAEQQIDPLPLSNRLLCFLSLSLGSLLKVPLGEDMGLICSIPAKRIGLH